MAFCQLLILCATLLFLGGVAADNNGTVFLYPVKDLEFNFLDTVNVSWTSNYSSATLYTWCRESTISVAIQKSTDPAPPFNASQEVVLDFRGAGRCWFNLRSNSQDDGDNSPSFNFIPTRRSQTTLGLASGSPTPTSSASPSSSPGTGTETPVPTTNRPSPSSSAVVGEKQTNPNVGLMAGVAIGSIMGVLIITVLAFMVYRRRRKARDRAKAAAARERTVAVPTTADGHLGGKPELSAAGGVHELGTGDERREMT